MAPAERLTYKKAVEELEKILAEMESEDVDIDLLTEKVKRAAFLIRTCRERLRKTEMEVRKVLAEIEEPPAENGL